MRNDFVLFFDGFDVESSLIEEQYFDDNLAFIAQRAQQFEDLIGLYHIPRDLTGEGWDYYPPVGICWSYTSAKFYNNTQLLNTFDPLDVNSPYNNLNNRTFCGDRGHTSLYEGVYTAGEAFRYAWAKRHGNTGEMNNALERILELVKAYDLICNISPVSALVRYCIPDTVKARELVPNFFDTWDHYYVQYKGFNWSLGPNLSRDVTIGILFGLSMVYRFVDDLTIRAIASRIIDKTVQRFYDCNWRIVDSDGQQHTSGDFIATRPMIDGSSILTFLQMAKMVNPEKWAPIYDYYVYDRDLANNIGRTQRLGIDMAPKVFDAYYGLNFMYNNAPTLILLETDPDLRELYIKEWLNYAQDFTKLHRNANFDVVWLLCHTEIQDNVYATPTITLKDYDLEIWKTANIKNPTDLDYIYDFTVRDIKDCLMRYAIRRYPNRNYYWATTPGTFPNKHQAKINIGNYIFPYPEYDYWLPDASSLGLITGLLSGAGRSIKDEGTFNSSLPVDMRKTEDLMWQRQSFSRGSTESITNSPGGFQAPAGPEYLSVYWMAKYLELF